MNSTSPPSRLCAPLAGPFRHVHNENTAAIYWIVFSIVSIILTCFTRRLVLGFVIRSPPTPNQTPAAAVLTTGTTPCARCQHIPDPELPPPPPFEPPLPPETPLEPTKTPAEIYEELLAADKERLKVVPSVPCFIFCTLLTIANITSLILVAFAIQAFLYCGSELTAGTPIANRQQRAYTICFWIIYGVISVAWASSGVLCWPIWVRNLWGGEEAAEKYPIRTDFGGLVLLAIFMVPCMLIALLFVAVVMIPKMVVKKIWTAGRGKPKVVVDGSAAERGIGCESEGSSVTQVESMDEKR